MITAIHKSMAAKRDAIKNDDKGFTLIELLVVVLIIGILAAIAIPVFLGQQNQAKDAAAQSDLGNAKIALISYATSQNGSYTGATAGTIANYGYKATDSDHDAVVNLSTATVGAFCIQEASGSGTTFAITETGGAKKGSCTDAGVFVAP